MMIKVADILTRLSPIEVSALWDAAEAVPFNAWDLTVGDFCRIIDNPDGVVDYCKKNIKADTVEGWCGRAKGVVDGVAGVLKSINSLDMPATADELRAMNGVEFLTFTQSIICDTVVFFSLKSTEEAERLAVADWFIFAKKRHSEALFRKNYDKIVQKKYAKR